MSSTIVSRTIKASPAAIYAAFLDPQALAHWLPPGDMRGTVHAFEPREGGAFSMSLTYPEADAGQGKSSDNVDRFQGRFVGLRPDECVVWAVRFDSDDPAMAGEMIISWELAPIGADTEVTVACEHIPPGIRPEDNEAGSRESLAKLARFLER